jgi:predicted transcriptional regulator
MAKSSYKLKPEDIAKVKQFMARNRLRVKNLAEISQITPSRMNRILKGAAGIPAYNAKRLYRFSIGRFDFLKQYLTEQGIETPTQKELYTYMILKRVADLKNSNILERVTGLLDCVYVISHALDPSTDAYANPVQTFAEMQKSEDKQKEYLRKINEIVESLEKLVLDGVEQIPEGCDQGKYKNALYSIENLRDYLVS